METYMLADKVWETMYEYLQLQRCKDTQNCRMFNDF
jgi:hypothetical protein